MAGFGTTEKAIINAAKFAPLMGKMYQWVFVGIREGVSDGKFC